MPYRSDIVCFSIDKRKISCRKEDIDLFKLKLGLLLLKDCEKVLRLSLNGDRAGSLRLIKISILRYKEEIRLTKNKLTIVLFPSVDTRTEKKNVE